MSTTIKTAAVAKTTLRNRLTGAWAYSTQKVRQLATGCYNNGRMLIYALVLALGAYSVGAVAGVISGINAAEEAFVPAIEEAKEAIADLSGLRGGWFVQSARSIENACTSAVTRVGNADGYVRSRLFGE